MQTNLFDATKQKKNVKKENHCDPYNKGFSDLIVFVDESGDHSLSSIDENYPIFVLAFCVFYKKHYWEKVVPSIERFKFQNFGHDSIILHETDITKERSPFKFKNRNEHDSFLDSLTNEIVNNRFILISCVIDKKQLQGKTLENPYHIGLRLCLDALFDFVKEKNQQNLKTHILFECRGKKEDQELELEFRRVCDGDNRYNQKLPFEMQLADKKANSPGLQLADLVARPIGLSILRPKQINRAFDVLKEKFFCSGGRKNLGEGIEGWGLKVFPQKAKNPDETHRG